MSVKKSVNALGYFKSSFGCFVREGAVTPAYRAVSVQSGFPAGIKSAFYSKNEKLYFVCTDGGIFFSDGDGFVKICDCNSSPFLIEDIENGGARTVIISGDTAAVCEGGTFSTVILPVSLSCGTMHCGRLFGADGLNLRWSGDGGFNDWNESLSGSGRLTLDPARGAVLDICTFGGKLIAVREYGITVLNMYGSPENFSVEISDTDCDKIFKNTARVVGGRLYFYSASGLKCFDGAKISFVKIKNSDLLSEPTDAVSYCGKYFLACKSGYLDRKVILCVDTADNESCVIDAAAEALFLNDGVYLCNEGELKKIIEGGSFYFESGAIDFGTGRLKTVIRIDIPERVDIRISSENATRLYYNAVGVIRPHMRGKSFIIEVNGKTALNAVTVTAEVTDAV